MNLCVRQNISLWKIRVLSEEEFCFYMYADDIWLCQPMLRKTHTQIKILKKYGVPFFTFHYRKRFFFPLALAVVCLCILYYSGFVWKIEVIGNSNLSEDTMITYLQEKKAGFGSEINKIDCPSLELAIRQDFDAVIWSSVYIRGTKLIVEIQENINQQNDTAQTFSDPADCSDLVAAKDAVIASIITRSGVPYVTEGQEVHKGDLLVSGCQEIRDDSGEVAQYYYQSADADVSGIVIYEYKDNIPVHWQEESETGQKRTHICIGWKDWFFESPAVFPVYDNSHVMEEYHQLHLADNFYLPFFAGKKTYREFEYTTQTNSEETAAAKAKQDLDQFLSNLEQNGVQIISKNVRMVKRSTNYVITGEIKACESIAVPEPTAQKEIPKEGTTTDEHE